jgi:FAD/FMN-containing dehydrogenase
MVEHAMNSAISAMKAALGDKAVITDQDDIAPWLTDWRRAYTGSAPAIIAPASTRDVQRAVQIAAAHGIAIVPQGGNTSMVAGATPPADGSALILSLRRMTAIRSLNAESNVAVAEAGVVLETLHILANEQGWRFPLSLGAKGSATIGGLVSTNAGGTQVLRFGTMRSLVLGVEAVLPDGSIWEGLAALKKDNRGFDLTQLLVGGEGTLGIVTAAALKLVPAIADSATGWLAVDSPQAALRTLRRFEARSGSAIESFELVPRYALEMVMKHVPHARAPFSDHYPWLVLVDYVGADASAALTDLMQDAMDHALITDGVVAANQAQAAAFWMIRDSISQAERADGPTVAHDISVPVDAMPDFITQTARVVEAAFPGVTSNAYGHLGDGNVHFHVNAPHGADPAEWMQNVGKPATRMIYDLVTAAGGSLSAEHGIGQMKLDDYARLASPARVAAQQAIKAALDPKRIMNPGKLIPPNSPALAPTPAAP